MEQTSRNTSYMEQTEDHAVSAKLGAIAALTATALVFTLVPLLMTRRRGSTKELLRFGGGVLLATTFLHLLPELRESLEDLPSAKDLPVQLPELLMCLGFFFMYLVEELAHYFLDRRHNHDEERKRLCDDHHDLNNIWNEGTPLRAVMITLAISVHEVFEGLAVGLEGHSNQVWILTGAIAAHKSVIALCIGTELSRVPVWGAATLVTIFTLATPIGITGGLLLSSASSMGLTSFILQGMATGTLLYVVFFEVLRPEGRSSLASYISALVGFLAMLILLYFFES